MRFELDEVTQSVRDEMTRKAAARLLKLADVGASDPAAWAEIAEFGLLTPDEDGLRNIDVVVGVIALAKGGLPGPVLEASLAVAAGSAKAEELVRAGKFVSSVPPGAASTVIAGWGEVAELIVDQGTGAELGGAVPVATALPMQHARVQRPEGTSDPLAARRWMLASALEVGLGLGMVDLATKYVQQRIQFGRPLASFQAVQFRLVEAVTKLNAAELMVHDAARRADAGDPLAEVTAALAWVYLSTVSEFVEKQAHQVFGAMGFTTEMGLVRFAYQSSWLRTSVDRRAAVRLVLDSRSTASAIPPSVITAGFAV